MPESFGLRIMRESIEQNEAERREPAMAEDITTQLRGAAAMTPGQRLWACDKAADEIDRLREQIRELSAGNRRPSEQVRKAQMDVVRRARGADR